MDYEKLYKDTLERAKKLKETCDSTAVVGWCEYLFPELKVSEDERIRKGIYNALEYLETELTWDTLYGVDILDAYAWLEKQGQTFTKKDVDDAYLKGVCDAKSELEKQGKSKFEQCVQEGDKIVTNKDGTHFNVSQLERVAKKEPKFKVGDEIKTINEEPLIITKIDKKGYWSEELFICGFDEECIWDLVEKKSAWSEEDENKVTLFMQLAEGCDNEEELADWLKSLKNRVQPQPHWKPSDKQMKALNYVVNLMASSESPKENDYYYNVFKDLREQLKKLKG